MFNLLSVGPPRLCIKSSYSYFSFGSRAPIHYKYVLLPVTIGNPIVEIRRSWDRLISTMGFHILVRCHLYIKSGPRPESCSTWHSRTLRNKGILRLQNFTFWNKANLRYLIAATGQVISNWIQIVNFSARMTVKFDGWPRKTIGHFFYTRSSFVHHFKSIGEFKLDLQSRNTQFGSKLVICYPLWPWNLTDDLAKQ